MIGWREMMSNPIYDMMKQVEIQKDIAEIHAILSGYCTGWDDAL